MITLNSNIDAAKRKDAFIMATKLMEGGELLETEKESLYKYFSPALPKTAKEPWKWVAKAVPTNDVRYYLNYLYSDGGRLIGTDGHRMHFIETDLKAGFYNPKTLDPITVDGRFPDIERVIPKKTNFKEYVLSDLVHGSTPLIKSGKTIEHVIIGKHKTHVNKDYLYQAFNKFDGVKISVGENDNSSILGQNDFGSFVIMPMRK